MRYLLATMFILVSPHASFSEAPAKAPAKAAAAESPAGYRMIRKDGNVYLLTKYVKQGNFYLVTDFHGKVSSHMVDSVASIEPLPEKAFAAAGRDYETPGASRSATSVRRSARTSSRSTAKPTARLPDPEPPPSVVAPVLPVPYLGGSPGTTATGIPLHVGPRGGIYHYSASGKKVYQRKK